MDDLHQLPKFRDALSFLYLEHVRIEQDEKSIAFWDAEGKTPVPVAGLSVLMLGPGTNITHAAIRALADNNCLVIWCGEQNVRFYSFGMGGTRSAAALLRQARLVGDEALRLEVVKRRYRTRFRERLPADLTVQQLRGMEGIRVREAYARASRDSGVPWTGRSYDRKDWRSTDPVNRALSAANSCLYGICHAAILSVGYSPALGFIHTGKQLSFVYDIADLYKVELTIPLAFRMATGDSQELERQVRLRCRDVFRESRLIQRIIPDIRQALGDGAGDEEFVPDEDPALPTDLWTPTAELASDPEAAPALDAEEEASPWS
jgi:CRISPR-associated protein Cas1